MRIHHIPALELDDSLWQSWASIQRADPALRSPYYHPEFTRRLARSGGPASVAVLEGDSGRVDGFFPHGSQHGGRVMPIGDGMADYHGAIARANVTCTAADWLRACGGLWHHFDHMPMSQAAFAPLVVKHHVSPVSDMRGGWNGYVRRLGERDGHKTPTVIRQVEKSERRMVRDLGPLRFERHAVDRAGVMQKLVEWKTAQRQRTGTLHHDPFVLPWVRRMLDDALYQGQADFKGALCALYAGDQLVSCHYGLLTHDTLHLWFASYDTQHSYYQPSMVMFLRLLHEVEQDGITLVDYGRGAYGYKMRLCTDLVPMGEGVVSRPAWVGQAWGWSQQAKNRIKQHPCVAQYLQTKKNATAAVASESGEGSQG